MVRIFDFASASLSLSPCFCSMSHSETSSACISSQKRAFSRYLPRCSFVLANEAILFHFAWCLAHMLMCLCKFIIQIILLFNSSERLIRVSASLYSMSSISGEGYSLDTIGVASNEVTRFFKKIGSSSQPYRIKNKIAYGDYVDMTAYADYKNGRELEFLAVFAPSQRASQVGIPAINPGALPSNVESHGGRFVVLEAKNKGLIVFAHNKSKNLLSAYGLSIGPDGKADAVEISSPKILQKYAYDLDACIRNDDVGNKVFPFLDLHVIGATTHRKGVNSISRSGQHERPAYNIPFDLTYASGSVSRRAKEFGEKFCQHLYNEGPLAKRLEKKV